ncbi:hypothetical protein GQ464_009695 [Rhodocaloribacter litoris]|uniref:hypothetical protein n=1 Tax=Rhodocaloribacter litoris TaxID=2558931 RepID=UPI00141D9D5D|nr:hypothetical protein [Rhodocaloribacter litoris]QXD13747.1 hypothetical protein GQ464_009695 [Rhodocaloribacter litoris]
MRWLWALCGVVVCLPGPAAAQPAPAGRHVQVGVGVLPSGGLQVGYVALRSFYTQEFVLGADVSPSFGGGEGNVQLSGGLGGAVRIFGFERTLGNAGYRGYDLDVGLRFGPGLLFSFNETRFTKNRRFSLFVDLFARFSSLVGEGRVLYLEVGLHRPVFRGGLWFTF